MDMLFDHHSALLAKLFSFFHFISIGHLLLYLKLLKYTSFNAEVVQKEIGAFPLRYNEIPSIFPKWHRFFMVLTWSMTIAAFVIIFVELSSWSSETIHASVGLATTILCFIQPFMAAMRPHPGAPRRALFNWAHWFVGNVAKICACKLNNIILQIFRQYFFFLYISVQG